MATDPNTTGTTGGTEPPAPPATVPDITAAATVAASGVKAGFQSLKDEAQNLAGTAKTAARNAATTGKDKAAEALSEAAGFIEDAARTLDDKIGNGVGEYARKAGSVATDLADQLKTRNVDELVEDAKSAVRQNPAIAVGVAAAVGFLLTRVFRLGGKPGNDRA